MALSKVISKLMMNGILRKNQIELNESVIREGISTIQFARAAIPPLNKHIGIAPFAGTEI